MERRDAPVRPEETTRSSHGRLTLVALVGLLSAVTALYGPVLLKLWHDWLSDEDYSHGVLIVPVAAWLVWRQRHRLRDLPLRPSPLGLVVVIGSLALFIAGSLAAELFTTRLSLIGLIAGSIAYLCSWKHLRIVAFPVAFLIFMIPLPTLVLDQATQSLQLVASGMGERLLRAAAIPVLRDGNVLTLPTITLNVTDACSGVRSLMSLLAVTSLVAHLEDTSAVTATVLTFSAVPLAIGLNGLRIAVTGIAATHFGPQMARGALHEATGWAVFVIAFLSVWILQRLLRSPHSQTGVLLETVG